MVDICTMWDDGLVSDLPLIEELNKRGIKASFALSPGRYKEWHVLNDSRGAYGTLVNINELSHYAAHDVVSHGVNHYDMTMLSSPDLRWELQHSQMLLSGIFRRPITGLCYPYGCTDHSTMLMVAEYYKSARSLPRKSKHSAQAGVFKNPHDVRPSAHWSMPQLVSWVLANSPKRVLIWGHTYEFGADGLQRVLEMYDALAAERVNFVTFEEIVHARYD